MAELSDKDLLMVLQFLEDGEWHVASEVIAAIGWLKNLRNNTELKVFQAGFLEFQSLSLTEVVAIIRQQGIKAVSFQKLRLTSAGKTKLKKLRGAGAKR